MQTWSVTARGLASVEVKGRNWLVALGRGLEEFGRVAALQRLACEVLPNGTVIARDIATGTGYVVQQVAFDADEVTAEAGPSERAHTTPPPPEEDTGADPVYDLPADAISELSMDESPVDAVLAADTAIEACRMTLRFAREKVPAEAGAVILEERGYLRFSAVDGPASRKLTGVRLPLGTGVAGYAMEKRKAMVLANAHDDPRHCGEVDALTGYVTREIAVVPLVRGDRVLGVLELMNCTGDRRFGDADLAVMRVLADGLALRLGH